MENKRLEQLFKNKLGAMVIEPSKAAHDTFARKILVQKHKILVKRISIAASIILFALAGMYAFLPYKAEKVDLARDGSVIFEEGVGMAINNALTVPELPDEDETGEVEENSGHVNEPVEHLAVKSDINVTNDSFEEKLVANSQATAIEDSKPDVENNAIEEMMATQVDESVYVEYFIDDPQAVTEPEVKEYEPVKITIEYIAAGKNKEKAKDNRRDFYSKMDNIKSVDEVLGDLRTYKDRLFALDFKKENKVKDE